jgi:hypothetical protein
VIAYQQDSVGRFETVFHLGINSLRRGGAQALWDMGFGLDQIMRRGRWLSHAWKAYIDTSHRVMMLASGDLA